MPASRPEGSHGSWVLLAVVSGTALQHYVGANL